MKKTKKIVIANKINFVPVRFFAVFAFCFIFISFVNAQSYIPKSGECDNSNANTNPDYINYYKRIETYIPDENAPVKYIRIALNIFTGPGTIQKSDATVDSLKQIIGWLNDFYVNIDSATYHIDGVPWIKNTKIHFKLDNRIYFYEGTKLYNSSSISLLEKHIASVDSSRLNNLNIYITNAGKVSPYSHPPYPAFILEGNGVETYSGLDNLSGIYISTFHIVYPNSQTLAHEIGHSLDLLHTYEHSCCHETCNASDPEYLYDLFGPNPPAKCWEHGHFGCEITPGENTCTNNMMGGNNMLRYYCSPMQMGKMHRALSIKSVRKYVEDDVYDSTALDVTKNEIWNFDIRLYSSIVVHKGATLTITGKVHLPQQASITVKRGATLIVDGGSVAGTQKGWQGINAKKGSTALQRLFGPDAKVEIKNGGYVQSVVK